MCVCDVPCVASEARMWRRYDIHRRKLKWFVDPPFAIVDTKAVEKTSLYYLQGMFFAAPTFRAKHFKGTTDIESNIVG